MKLSVSKLQKSNVTVAEFSVAEFAVADLPDIEHLLLIGPCLYNFPLFLTVTNCSYSGQCPFLARDSCSSHTPQTKLMLGASLGVMPTQTMWNQLWQDSQRIHVMSPDDLSHDLEAQL